MYRENMLDSMMIEKILVITGFVLAMLCLTTAEASISETRELSVEFTNELIQVPAGLEVPIDISVEITGTIEVTGPGGYKWTQSISGPGSSTYSRTLGSAGTYTVTEDYETTVIGTPTGLIGALIDPTTKTYTATATPWTFNATTNGATGNLEVTSTFGNISVSEHSDNISISISGISVTITTTQTIDIGDTISAKASGQVDINTSMTLSETPSGGTTPPAGTGVGMDVDIAISTQPNWISQDAADREMNEIVNNVRNSVSDIRIFTKDDESQLASWVTAHTNNSQVDVLILCGVIPNSIYPSGNQQPDGSIAETFLEAGNMIINTADYMFWIPYNSGAGLQNMMDLPDVTMWYGGDMNVTSLGQQYLPSLNSYYTSRAFSLDSLESPWSVEAVFAQNNEGTLAEPVVVRDTITNGRLVIFYQLIDDNAPRGEVISEFILNWLPTVVGGSSTPSDGGEPSGESEGLVAYWNFDERQGTVVHDVAGNNDGIINGNPRWVDGYSGGGLEFDGTTNYVDCGADASLDITQALTIAAWIKVDDFQNWDGIVVKGVNSSSFAVQVWDDGALRFSANWGILNGAVGSGIFNSNTKMTEGEWFHIAITHDGRRLRFYINGTLDSEINNTVTFGTTAESLILGCDLPGGDEYFDGIMDEVRIYSYELTGSEVQQIMGTAPPVIPPDGSTPTEPGEFVLVGTDPDDALWANIDQVFASSDTSKITFKVTSNGQWADDIYFSIEMDTDQNRNTGDPEDGVDHLIVVSMDGTSLSGGVFVYNPYQGEFDFTDATLYDVICGPDSDLFQVSALLDDIGNPDAIDFEVWMVLVDLADVAPDIGLYTYALGGTQTPDTPTTRTLSITSAEASPGSSTTVDLSISDAAGIAGGDVQISYDASVIAVTEINGTSLISGMNLMANMNTPGIITIGMAGEQGISSGSGALVTIELMVNASAQAGTQTTLRLTDAEMYSESGATIPVNSQNGVVQIIQGALKGDVNNDGRIRSNDAILALRFATGLATPTSYEQWAADMNGDGRIRSNDAILILREAAGLAAPERDFIASTRKPISVTLAEAHGVAGESITVPLRVDDIAVLAGGDIRIAYDSTVLRAVSVSSDSDLLLAGNVSEPGIVNIAFAGTTGLNSETLAQIQFDILADDVSPLSFQQVEFYNSSALPLNVKCMDEHFISWAVPPEHSALLQNFPNPFNPDTWIPYQLKDGREVTIKIHSAGGELVRELDLGYKAAGLYVSRDRATYWDGKNASGENVASGVYFYAIRAGDFTAVRKLIVLK